MEFGDRLVRELDTHGMSQRELARRLDVTPQAITNWVRGHGRPGRDNLVRLEDILGLPRGELMTMFGYRSPDDTERLVTLEEAIRADPEISPENKRALLRFVKMARSEAEAAEAEQEPGSGTTAPVQVR